jgi:two-component system sensor histidine kinase PilS (NtrC family)
VGELAAGLAHEIRNPLAAISGAMEVLQQDLSLHGEYQTLMGIAMRETERLDGLIGQFLLYARPSSPHKRSCNLVPLVKDTLALLRTHPDCRSDIAIVERYSDPRLSVEVDANQVRQVVWNLVLNALQAMPQGGRLELCLRSVAAATGSAVQMVISDTGCGIRPDDIPRMFVPFFTTKPGGSGLGLAIVHRIVEEHGGHVDVHSEWAKGTQVVVTFPVGTARGVTWVGVGPAREGAPRPARAA